ncbi:FadR/GntR family transcriptional regulator [Ottowia sp.]|uniref:FadR/GntR family transcriptional regulator n=1 Tax=Ottowia sp. TaxID=1898956 RepID=UPI0025E51696|nr:FadR/GntR family transcriptional regulator [Ottowia sp.]
MMIAHRPPRSRPRSLTVEVVEAVGDRIRDGSLAAGAKLPREADLMADFGVSRTVVREAISRLQAAGMVATRHGVGTFVVGAGDTVAFRIDPEQMATLQDVIDVLELRIALETECAGLAAARRTEDQLQAIREALAAFVAARESGQDAVGADFQFHLEIARATHNRHFVELMNTLGLSMIPRVRLATGQAPTGEEWAYLGRVSAEHQSVLDAIARQDVEGARAAMRTHLANSRQRRQLAAHGH